MLNIEEGPAMFRVISKVEDFLLPSQDERYWSLRLKGELYALPSDRLDQVLFQVAIADHIRLMQSLYRDSEDNQALEADLRAEYSEIKLPNKILMTRITEGRARAVALCRLCYGEDSIESLRALIDLANSYASQGMWPQVSEHMTAASQKLIVVYNRRHTEAFEHANKKARIAAERVTILYSVLRDHAMQNYGEVKSTIVDELLVKLHERYGKSSNTDEYTDRGQPMQLAEILKHYFEQYKIKTKSVINNAPSTTNTNPSWGEVIDFLRRDCSIISAWLAEMDRVILPQHKAIMRLAFHLADVQKKGVVHPALFSMYLARFPAVARAIAGTQLVQNLTRIKTHVPIHISVNESNGEIDSVGNVSGQRVEYELPVTWEEVFALNVVECETDTLDLLRVQILTMLGVCQVFAGKLSDAEEKMNEALRQLSRFGMEMEVTACELYNSIAQMMIMKHRQYHAKRRNRFRREVEKRLDTEAGKREVLEESKDIRKKAKLSGIMMLKDEADLRARAALIKAGVKQLAAKQEDPTLPSLQAAYRYLIRSLEILERVHGTAHPAVGSAYLAIASIQNVMCEYEGAREWLVKALRLMEKLQPVPTRAIAFVQVQLSQVLNKKKHPQEAMQVLGAAVAFHVEMANGFLSERSTMSGDGFNRSPLPDPMLRHRPEFEDIRTALSLLERLTNMATDVGSLELAKEYAQQMADLAEAAYGWDSEEAALSRKEVAINCMNGGDWGGACVNLVRALEAHEMIFGDRDSRTVEVAQMLQEASNRMHLVKPGGLGGRQSNNRASKMKGGEDPKSQLQQQQLVRGTKKEMLLLEEEAIDRADLRVGERPGNKEMDDGESDEDSNDDAWFDMTTGPQVKEMKSV